MRRPFVAAVWIAGATVPPLLAAVFLVGCCVLPFHKVVHKLMPICQMAANVMKGDHASDGHEHDAVPPTPAREKQDPVKRMMTDLPGVSRLSVLTAAERVITPSATTSYRSFITLGAVRCDRDVGLHVLVETFQI